MFFHKNYQFMFQVLIPHVKLMHIRILIMIILQENVKKTYREKHYHREKRKH